MSALANPERRLYGLAQNPQDWSKEFGPKLLEIAFVPLRSDSRVCIQIYNLSNTVVIITLYAEHLLMMEGIIRFADTTKKKLVEKFQMNDMGDLSPVLGM